MPTIEHTYRELDGILDPRPGIREHYVRSVATRGRVLDIGGRNQTSRTAERLRNHGAAEIVATDIVPDYGPDLVDDITATSIAPESFDAVYCDAVLEHVTDYHAAMENIRRILRPGGEVFIYVPFCWGFHDLMDYHRFTISEVARLVGSFTESKVFLPGDGGEGGWGYVVLLFLTYGAIFRRGRTHRALAGALNWLLGRAVRLRWRLRRPPDHTADQAAFFAVHLVYNHGFCAWARK